MDFIQNLEVEGYKGLEYADLPLSQINLITGRNNTGKTSFLESIELLYQPRNLRKYSANLDSLVNRNYDKTHIEGKIEGSKREINISTIDEDRIHATVMRALQQNLIDRRMIRRQISDMHSIDQLSERSDADKFAEDLESALEGIIQDLLSSKDLSTLKDDFVVIDDGNEEYIFHNIDVRRVLDDRERMLNRLLENDSVAKYDDEIVEHIFNRLFRYHVPRGNFLDQPPKIDDLKFIQSAEISPSMIEKDDESNAVKIDDIGDFIREKSLVDNLKTFDLDTLVFKDEEGKYQIPFRFMGDGFKSIVAFLWELIDQNKTDVILVEEPENHMHPGYIAELVSFLIQISMEENIQLFVTTHDMDFVNEFFSDNLSEKKEEFLREEFSLFQFKAQHSIEIFEYEKAMEHLKEFQIDLRGL